MDTLVYSKAEPFSDGLALVEYKGKRGFINTSGDLVIGLNNVEYSSFSGGLARARDLEAKRKRLSYLIDKSGRNIGTLTTDSLADFKSLVTGGTYAISKVKDKYGLVDANLNTILEPVYDKITWAMSLNRVNPEPIIITKKESEVGFFNLQGPLFILSGEFYNINIDPDLAVITYRDRNNPYFENIIDYRGSKISKKHYSSVYTPSTEGLLCVSNNSNKMGAINFLGQEVIPCKYDFIGINNNGLFPVSQQNKWGVVNAKNKLIVPFLYDCVRPFSEGYAHVLKNDKWGFITKNGTVVAALKYEQVIPFKGGVAAVRNQTYWGFIDTRGRAVLPTKFDQVKYSQNSSVIAAQKDGFWRFYDKKGTPVTYSYYSNVIEPSANGSVWTIKREGYAGLLHINGNIILGCNRYREVDARFGPPYKVFDGAHYGFINEQGDLIPTDPAFLL
jgi:hypothetical protein